MARINLLPWREWERERKKNEFLLNLFLVLAAAGLAVFLWGMQLDGANEDQVARNKTLQTEIDELDTKIAQIADLAKQREELLSRMRVIQDLQGNRPVIVRIFDEMVRSLSSGVHYESLEMKGTDLAVNGVAESNNRISSLMRNIDASDWFARPNLKTIKEDPNNPDYGAQASTFELSFVQVNPNVREDEPEG
ncbi:MAG: PilN domain-containing protein [Pseudomonadota bacterium]